MEAGEPGSYLTLEPGAEAIGADGGRVGTVEHVLGEPEVDIFDGIVIRTHAGSGGHRFVDAAQVAEIRDGSVTLTVGSGDVDGLPEPRPGAAEHEHQSLEDTERELKEKLGRAWDAISGRR